MGNSFDNSCLSVGLSRRNRLIKFLYSNNILFGIATSGNRPEIDGSLDVLGISQETVIVERGNVARAKPEPISSWHASSVWALV